MRQFVCTLTLLLFFIWILPLGFFIKPSQEKQVCGGQRAICLCHVATAKPQDRPLEGVSLKGSTDHNAKRSPANGGINYFTLAQSISLKGVILTSHVESNLLCYKSPYLVKLDHVPKV